MGDESEVLTHRLYVALNEIDPGIVSRTRVRVVRNGSIGFKVRIHSDDEDDVKKVDDALKLKKFHFIPPGSIIITPGISLRVRNNGHSHRS